MIVIKMLRSLVLMDGTSFHVGQEISVGEGAFELTEERAAAFLSDGSAMYLNGSDELGLRPSDDLKGTENKPEPDSGAKNSDPNSVYTVDELDAMDYNELLEVAKAEGLFYKKKPTKEVVKKDLLELKEGASDGKNEGDNSETS